VSHDHRADDGETGEDRFHVLFVCTGNLCRSPFAEILTRHLLADRLGPNAAVVTVASAGTEAVVGAAMHPDTLAELPSHGVPAEAAESFVARQLSPELIAGADLVLGATTMHRAAIVRTWPRALPVAFTIREFARLTDGVDTKTLPTEPVSRGRALVAAARARRGMSPPAAVETDEVPDPVGLGATAQSRAASAIQAAVDKLVHTLVPADA